MKNFNKIKNNLKTTSKKKELENNPYFCVSHINQNSSLQGIKSNLPKNQYLANDFANLVPKTEIKFPLETYTYNSKEELIKEIATKKNILGFVKIDFHLFLNKEIMKSYNFNQTSIYYKINAIYLNFVQIIAILNQFNAKSITKVA